MTRLKRFVLNVWSRISRLLTAAKNCILSLPTALKNSSTYTRIALPIWLAAAVMFSLTYYGVFDTKLPQRPATAAKLQNLPPDRLEKIIAEQPTQISSITFYEGLNDAIVYGNWKELNGYLVANVDKAKLLPRLDAAAIKHDTQPADVKTILPDWVTMINMLLGIGSAIVLMGYVIRRQNRVNQQYWSDPIDDSDPEARRLSYNAPQGKDMSAKPAGEPLTWDDVAGNPEAINRFRRIERFIKFAAWFKLCGARTPKGILLVGPPGTGKTLLVKILAWVCGCNFLQVSGSDFEERLVGVGASRWRKMVKKAVDMWKENGKLTIVFIDEVECIAKKRGEREHTETLTAMLTSIDGFASCPGLIFLAATNHPEVLDPAFIRPGRFGDRVNIDLPDMAARMEILKIKVRKLHLHDNVNLQEIARRTNGFSGAELEQVCNEAATMMAERMLPQIEEEGLEGEALEQLPRIVMQEDLHRAVEYVQMGDELLSRMASQTAEDRRNTEIHEAGHAYINHKVGGPPPVAVSRVIRQKSLGVFSFAEDKDISGYTDKQLLGRIKVMLAGRLATELLLNGCRDTGPSEDFRMASRIARQMVGIYGMSEEFGYGSIALNEQGMPVPGQLSAWLHEKFDKAWSKILDDCKTEATKLINEGKEFIEKLADAMDTHEKLYGDEITRICNGEDPAAVLADREAVKVAD
ncbi:MAG: AAA family ATPase [Candidatus Obscuribacterales bacterium]|nr:AAA family ATPase [Candidatus Obscuribacterales bacterium]